MGVCVTLSGDAKLEALRFAPHYADLCAQSFGRNRKRELLELILNS